MRKRSSTSAGCRATKTPSLAIHDVGAGSLSNAFPELTNDAGRGALRPARGAAGESGLAPKEIWCNESQERYVLAIAPESLEQFKALCERERCPFAVVGVATEERQLVLSDEDGVSGAGPSQAARAPRGQRTQRSGERGAAVNMPMNVLLGKPPKMHRDVKTVERQAKALVLNGGPAKAVIDVLAHPTVASKRFLITIGDRTVGGLTHRDQMVGPWQVPVADCAVTLADFKGLCWGSLGHGRAHAAGRAGRSGIGPYGGGRAITNLLAAPIELSRVPAVQLDGRLREPGEDAALYATVKAVGMELCPALGIFHPVGRDSLSMRAVERCWPETKVTSRCP